MSTPTTASPPDATAVTASSGRTDGPPSRVSRLTADRHAELQALYCAHRRELVGLATLVGADPATAEDLVQEAFARLAARRRRLDHPDRALGYVRTTIVNLARGRARREAVARRFRADERRHAPSAEELASRSAAGDAVVDALRSLPRRQREVMVLRHWCGMSESAVAETLGIGVGSVRTHTSRARTSLAAELGGLL